MNIKIDLEIINEIIANVFEEMLAMNIEALEPAGCAFNDECVNASIRITGIMDGIVVVDAPVKTAREIATVMFDADEASLAEDEILDAVGEIVNMIGGNIKGLSEGESQLSLPCVSCDTGASILDTPLSAVANILVSGLPLRVSWCHLANDSAAV